KDLTMDIEDTAVDVNSLLTVNMDNQVFAHQHLQDISTTVQSWDLDGIPLQEFTTIPEAQDWLSAHRLAYPVGDLDVGDTFQMNYTVQVSARGRINAIGPDSVVRFRDGYELPLPPTYIDVENIPPVFRETGNKIIDRLDPLRFTISATDADDDPLTYFSVLLPTGATFDGTTREFAWPDGKDPGCYEVIFSVTDGMATVPQIVYITVTDLRPKINIS
ncbi:MAG: Ig domain-containing protein, partial [Methanomicrobiales archaeon]|nr:Ig domain-containing protein [Methanomicrobiales archaeon]MDD1654329.1 Ig domain-containing protein [Methanomicrobiales archaeon]